MKLGFKEKCAGIFLQVVFMIESILSDQLHVVDHIMLDVSKPVSSNVNFTQIRAMCATFREQNPIYLQLWSPTNEDQKWTLDWQVKISPRYADSSEEVITLFPEQYSPNIKPKQRLGIINAKLPGPIRGVTHPNASILLSMDTLPTMTLPLNISVVMEFDALKMNYDFSLDVCWTPRCTEFWAKDRCLRADPAIKPASSTSGFQILSEDMVLGLIIWNLVLSIVVILTLITIVCMCNTLQKRKKDVRRFDNKYRNLEIASTAGTISTKGDDVIYTHGKSDDAPKSSTSRDSWVSTDGDRKKLHANDALEY